MFGGKLDGSGIFGGKLDRSGMFGGALDGMFVGMVGGMLEMQLAQTPTEHVVHACTYDPIDTGHLCVWACV